MCTDYCEEAHILANNKRRKSMLITVIFAATWYAGQLQENTIGRPVLLSALVTIG